MEECDCPTVQSLASLGTGCPTELHHLDLLIQFLHVNAELLIGVDEVVDGTACVENRRMVLVAAVQADGGQARFGVLFGKIHGQLACLDDLAFPGLGADGIDREVKIVAYDLLDEVDGNFAKCS